MKFLKAFLSAVSLCLVLFSTTSQLSSCKKTETIHDTTTVTIHDTTVIIDSIYDLTDGLVAYYNFNGGNLNDSSGYENDIIFSNATQTADRFGNQNNAYLFNGSSSYMQVKSSASLNPSSISLMAIVKLNGFYAGQCHGNQVFMKGTEDQANGIYGLRVTINTNDCYSPVDTTQESWLGFFGDAANTAGAFDVSNHVHTNQWMTVIYTYNGIENKLYVDGQLRVSNTITTSFTPNNNDLFIGKANNSTFPYWFNGVIDEIRIYNKALSPAIINRLSNLKK